MKKIPAGKILQENKRVYDKKPHDWRVLTEREQKGYADIFLSYSSTPWQLKTEVINSYELMKN